MTSPMHVTQIAPLEVGVNLCGRNIGVTQHLLDGGDVGASLQEMRRKRMSQGMRCHPLLEPALDDTPANDLPRGLAAERSSPSTEEEGAS
jgi:hypothetical protein